MQQSYWLLKKRGKNWAGGKGKQWEIGRGGEWEKNDEKLWYYKHLIAAL